MDLNFQDTVKLAEEFKILFNQSQAPLDKCKEKMDKLKLALTKFQFQPAPTQEQQRAQLVLAREVLEYGAFLSIRMKDIPAFERYYAQLKTYYYDYADSIPPSQHQHTILGLNLLKSLAKNNLAEFHTELELIPLEQHSNVFIKHPVQLEQYMMEGAYNQVFKARKDIPSDSYDYFMNLLMDTVRDEIADCIQKAYNTLSISEAQKLLGFSSHNDLQNYSQQRQWTITGNAITFKKGDDAATTKTDIPSFKLIKQTLHYARELERII